MDFILKKMKCFQISLLSFFILLVLSGCSKPVFTKFLIQFKSPELFHLYESNAKTVVFPILSKTYSVLDFNASSRGTEDLIRKNQGNIALVPFDDILKTVNDSDALETLVFLINSFYKKGDISPKDISRLVKVSSSYEPTFFLFLKLERAELYKDLKKEFKIQVTVSGKLYYIKSNSVVFSFVCTSFSKSFKKGSLPDYAEMLNLAIDEFAKGLPYDSEKAMRLENGADWQGQ